MWINIPDLTKSLHSRKRECWFVSLFCSMFFSLVFFHGHFWALFHIFEKMGFFGENPSSSLFAPISATNLMQKIRKILGANTEKNSKQTNRLTDGCYFWAFLGSSHFWENGNPASSLFSPYGPLNYCKKSEKSLEPILRRTPDKLTE